jgi:hypothetical protein
LLPNVKKNLVLDFDDDDSLLIGMVEGAVNYAEGFQNRGTATMRKTECRQRQRRRSYCSRHIFMKPETRQAALFLLALWALLALAATTCGAPSMTFCG